MSKIEEAKKAIMDLLEALRVHANMALCCEKPTVETDKMYQIVVDRANNWLSSIEPPLPVSVWEPHQQRVWIEKQELDERAMKLTEFVGGNPLFRKLTYEDQHLLYEQRRLMYQLSEVLDQRIKRFFPQEPEAVTVSVSMAPGAESLSAEKAKELDEYLRQQNKLKDEPEDFYPATSSGSSRTPNEALGDLAGAVKRLVGHFKGPQIKQRGAPKLFNVQDSERPAFVIAHSFEEALSKWKVAVAEENATDSQYEEVPPAGIMHVCDGDELIIDQGFADKANS